MANLRYSQIVIVTGIALQSCAPLQTLTPDEIRESDGGKTSFTVPVEFDDAVNNVFYASENCGNTLDMPVGHFTSRRSQDSEHNTATAIWGYDGPLGFNVFLVVDLIGRQHETEIRVSMKKQWLGTEHSLTTFADRVHQWVLGTTSCLGM
jgi:hypothetical protein